MPPEPSGNDSGFACCAAATVLTATQMAMQQTENRTLMAIPLLASLRQRSLEAGGEIGGAANAPIVEEHDARLLAGHVLVDGDHVDLGAAQRLENALQLTLEHGEVAVDHRLLVAAGERRPGVHAHGLADGVTAHLRG